MEKDSIVIDNTMLKHLVEKYTQNEKGVRNLKRCLEVIFSKLNLYTLMKPGTKLFGDKIIDNITYPYQVTEEIIGEIIKHTTKPGQYLNMYL
jgi:ATP-dependent Lon protease